MQNNAEIMFQIQKWNFESIFYYLIYHKQNERDNHMTDSCNDKFHWTKETKGWSCFLNQNWVIINWIENTYSCVPHNFIYWHDGLSERKWTPLRPHDMTYHGEEPTTLVVENKTMLPYNFVSDKKKLYLCVYCKRNSQIILNLYNMNK